MQRGQNGRGRIAAMLRLLAAAVLIAAAMPIQPLQALEIKIASVAPENSPYGTALKQLAAEWQRISGGTIRVNIYHNGIAGDQANILRKMRIGQLQGGTFANTGISAIAREALSVTVPFLIRDDREFAFVLKRLRPIIDQRLEEQGFKALAWAEAGWIYLFSRTPVEQPEQIRSLRLAVPPDEEDLLNTFRALGYRVVPVDIPETLSALNSGMVDAILSSPLLAAGYQWFGVARHMLELRIAPAMGCVLLSERAWRQIPSKFQQPFLDAARRAEEALQSGLQQLDDQAVDAMTGYGLRIVETSAADQAAWREEFERNRDRVIGSAFDGLTVRMIERDLALLRSGNGASD
ncbi:TRAP transporter substrate-binding protein [Salinispira pacifica]